MDAIVDFLPLLFPIALILLFYVARDKRTLGEDTIKAVAQQHGWERFAETEETLLGELNRQGTRGIYRGRRVAFYEASKEVEGPTTYDDGIAYPGSVSTSVWWELRVSIDHPTPQSTFLRSGLRIRSYHAIVPVKQELADWWVNHPTKIKEFKLDHGELMMKFSQGPTQEELRETMDFLVDAAERL